MVLPLGPMNIPQEGAPAAVKDRFSRWWWVLMGLLIAVCIGRVIAADIFGALLSGIMAVIAWYMVTNDCAKMSQYCILLFGFMCLMNGVLEFVTLASCLGGRQTSRTETAPTTSANTTTSYTVTIDKHPFFDATAGWFYNQQSLMMVICPLAAFLGAALAYFSYNAFDTSLFSEEGEGGNEAQNFGGGRLGGGFGAMGGAGGGGGGGSAFQNGAGRPQAAPSLWSGSGQRLGSG